MMRLAVIGSRDFTDYHLMRFVLCVYHEEANGNLQIVSGGARGADRLSEKFAEEFDLDVKIFLAEWHKYGKSAGYRRNAEIVDHATELVAFWDGKSKGTEHSINLARKAGKKVVVIDYLSYA